MITKTDVFELLFKSLIAGSINMFIYIISIILMYIFDNYFITPLLFSILNGIIISKLFKYNITSILTIFLSFIFTIINSIFIFLIIYLLIKIIKPANLFIISVFNDSSFNDFIGIFVLNMIGGIIYFGLSLSIFLIYLILIYTTRP